jgi:hypothetical protein
LEKITKRLTVFGVKNLAGQGSGVFFRLNEKAGKVFGGYWLEKEEKLF